MMKKKVKTKGKCKRPPEHRAYFITDNSGLTHQQIKARLSKLRVNYFCMCDEIAPTTGKRHTHIYFHATSTVRFPQVRKNFPASHIEAAQGTGHQCREYIKKSGKWEGTEKAVGNLPETFEEWGEVPQRGRRTDHEAIWNSVKAGENNTGINNAHPETIFKGKAMDKCRADFRADRFGNCVRELSVTYVHGEIGAKKMEDVFHAHDPKTLYRVTKYTYPFDKYEGQDVIIFDNFRDSLPIREMIEYLKGYPLWLPCRGEDRIACYTKVYIISECSLEALYGDIQKTEPKLWWAIAERIETIREYTSREKYREYSCQDAYF